MKSRKNYVIGVLCMALVFMGLGYSLYSSNLNLSGTATTSGTFDVKITNVVLDTTKKTSGATDTTAAVTANYAVTEQTLSATFSEPGDYITWNITATNRGTIEAAITVDVNMLNDANGAYKLECDVVEGITLAPGATTTFPCEMSFDKNFELTAQQFAALPKGAPVNMRIRLAALQKANYVAPAPQETDDSCFVSLVAGEINYYDSQCGDDVVIPANLSLKTKEIDTISINNDYCLVLASYVNDDPNVTDAQFCANLATQVAGMTYDQALSNGYGPILQITFTNESVNSYPITKIGRFAFHGKVQDSIVLSNNIITIGNHAFHGCEFTSVTIPSSVTSIGVSAFADGELETVDFSNATSLESIGEGAFYGNSIGSVVIPGRVETIGTSAFADNGMTSVSFANNGYLDTIGASAFDGNDLQGELTIPDSVTRIEGKAFEENQLTTLNIGTSSSSISYIGADAFNSAAGYSLSTINIKLTSDEWANVTKDSQWYSGSPTVTYKNAQP